MNSLCEKSVDFMIQNEVISSEDKEIYVYGLKQGFILLLNILTTLFIGFLFNKVLKTIIFLAAYIPLRIYAGGYHARTQLRCYICSVVLTISVLLAVEFIPWTNFIVTVVAAISGMIIFILSPVEDMNKPLDAVEVRIYGKRARIILCIELGVLALVINFGENSIAECILVSLPILSLMLVLGNKK